MIKIGDRVKGFISSHRKDLDLSYLKRYDGVEGKVTSIKEDLDIFLIEFEGQVAWWYPLGEYLGKEREEKLKQLGL